MHSTVRGAGDCLHADAKNAAERFAGVDWVNCGDSLGVSVFITWSLGLILGTSFRLITTLGKSQPKSHKSF